MASVSVFSYSCHHRSEHISCDELFQLGKEQGSKLQLFSLQLCLGVDWNELLVGEEESVVYNLQKCQTEEKLQTAPNMLQISMADGGGAKQTFHTNNTSVGNFQQEL